MAGGSGLPGGYEQARFTGRSESIESFLAAVMARLPERPHVRILDLGSGAGDLALALAAKVDGADVTGIDISAVNVAAATQRALASGFADRVRFVTADFRNWSDRPFDVIVSDGVLHLIPEADEVLAKDLVRFLLPGGLLIATIANECFHNSALSLQRRIWHAMPPALDHLALSIARRVYPNESAAVLADRVGYLRVVPARLHGPRISGAMREAGLEEREALNWPGASVFKLRHRLVVWRRVQD